MTWQASLFIMACIAAALYRHRWIKCQVLADSYSRKLSGEIVKNKALEEAMKCQERESFLKLRDEKEKYREAVKFAMICAHPDEPRGNEERFLKYKELYESMNRYGDDI